MPIGWLTSPDAMVPIGGSRLTDCAYPTWCMCTPTPSHPIIPMQVSTPATPGRKRRYVGANVPHGLVGLVGGIICFVLSEFGSVLFVCLLLRLLALLYCVCLPCLRFALLVGCACLVVCMCLLLVLLLLPCLSSFALRCALFLFMFREWVELGFPWPHSPLAFQELFLGTVRSTVRSAQHVHAEFAFLLLS